MKKVILSLMVIAFAASAQAQLLKDIWKKETAKDSSLLSDANKLIGAKGVGGLSTSEIANGLKEALTKGADSGSSKLSAVDGFFKDAAIKILLPDEAKKAEKTLRAAGLGSEVDKAILSLNRAAEDAAKSAAPVFLAAIKQMSITDAVGILKGSDTSATSYLKSKTTASLTTSFAPIIKASLEKVDATKYWNTVFTTYNKMPFASKVNPDLTGYVTEKALVGIFHEIALQEQDIRKNPMARTSDLLKKVFAQQ